MHVKAKNVATAGLLVALTVIMLVLSTVIESNSLFLIAAASFCVGVYKPAASSACANCSLVVGFCSLPLMIREPFVAFGALETWDSFA